MREVQADYQALVNLGYLKPLEEWDLEELSRGTPRNARGGFAGARPAYMNVLVENEIRRRFKQKAVQALASYLPKVLTVLGELLDADDPGVRLKAAQLMLEHILGKPTTTIDVMAEDKATSLLASALVLSDGSEAHPIQAEVIEGEFEPMGFDIEK